MKVDMTEQNRAYVEHANISVLDAKETIDFLTTAIPTWSVRGQGKMDWFGERIQWFHVGDENSYIAVQEGGQGKVKNWKESWTGVKHIGIVVSDLESLITRLSEAGYPVDHTGAEHPHRRNVYIFDSNDIQYEFMQYYSSDPKERNDYSV